MPFTREELEVIEWVRDIVGDELDEYEMLEVFEEELCRLCED